MTLESKKCATKKHTYILAIDVAKEGGTDLGQLPSLEIHKSDSKHALALKK